MTRCAGRALVLMMLFVGVASAQTPALNPTVKVVPRPGVAVAAECEEGMATQPVPRVVVEETPVPERTRIDLQPPPSRNLREQLAEIHGAIERNDRAAFDQWLASAKATLAGYPPGGERTEAQRAIAVYDDVKRLWDYQYANASGAFFDASVQNGSLLEMLRRYPGYDAFIADHAIEVSGNRIYPVRESRDFLARVAAERMGGRVAQQTAPQQVQPRQVDRREVEPRTPSTVTPTPQPPVRRSEQPRLSTNEPPSTRRSTTTMRESTRSSTSRPTRTTTRRSTTARRSNESRRDRSAADRGSEPTSVTATTTGATSPSSTGTASDPVSAPSSQETSTATSSTSAAPTTETIPPADPPGAVAPTQTAAAETTGEVTETTATTAPAPATKSGRNILFPVVLIFVGAAVLWLLFRASN